MCKICWDDTFYKFGCVQFRKSVADDESTNDDPVIWNISVFSFCISNHKYFKKCNKNINLNHIYIILEFNFVIIEI